MPISLAPSATDAFRVPDDHESAPVIRWGDPLTWRAPSFDPDGQSASRQAHQFGYNCDYVTYLPLSRHRDSKHGGSDERGLLWVNHEYTNPELMFAGYDGANPTEEQVAIELAAHGGSVVEVRRQRGRNWKYVRGSDYNRRITATTPFRITGPAAGHSLLRTNADPTGKRVLGMLNNCAGGMTPWGTVLTCEENFNQYFANNGLLPEGQTKAWHARYGLGTGASQRKWENFHDRFDLTKEPNEPFRFGWIVEIDPYDPDFVPRKRTALGRIKHEGATTALARDRRVVVYSGDDERFEYAYKFVSRNKYRSGHRSHNLSLLDEGTLFAARFDADGTGQWLPLVHGQGPLTAANGFADQASVLINARDAAKLLGATRMDRPEDIERNPETGAVYMVFTNNTNRTPADVDPANPRPANRHGHIIEVFERRDDPGATSFDWDIFMLCGDPTDPSTYFAGFDKSQVSPISSPDNITFDKRGNLWIGTDGMPGTLGWCDTVYAVPVVGEDRGFLRPFLSVPVGAEVTGPAWGPDDETLFVAVQHPGEGGVLGSVSQWPDFTGGLPRPSVVATRREDGEAIRLA